MHVVTKMSTKMAQTWTRKSQVHFGSDHCSAFIDFAPQFFRRCSSHSIPLLAPQKSLFVFL